MVPLPAHISGVAIERVVRHQPIREGAGLLGLRRWRSHPESHGQHQEGGKDLGKAGADGEKQGPHGRAC